MINSKLLMFTKDNRLLMYDGVKYDFEYSKPQVSDCMHCSLGHQCDGQSVEMRCIKGMRSDKKGGYWLKREEMSLTRSLAVDNRSDEEKSLADSILG